MEELRKYLQEKKRECLKEIGSCKLSSRQELEHCHKLTYYIEAYVEIINYIDNIKNK